jgi:enolase
MLNIKEVRARKLKDSRGKDTIEVSINWSRASSPSGTSAGRYETPSFHDSLDWNINAINNFKELKGIKINSLADLHLIEDLIKQKFKLKSATDFGANALFALESAILKALAASKNKELWQIVNSGAKRIPTPLGNAIGGGKHTTAKNAPSFQEFLLVPQGKSIQENVKIMNKTYLSIKSLIKSNKVGQEGEWQTSLSEEQILDILSNFKDVRIGLDVASSEFFNNGTYCYNNKVLSTKEQIDYLNSLIQKYNLIYVEDPLNEEEFISFSKISKKTLVSGDDLTVSHLQRVKKASKMRSINCMILKPNQVGSLLEISKVVKFCKRHNIKIVFSHRAGETLDDALADYAVGFKADFIKCGIATKWRKAKLNRLIAIERSLK